jgi:hemerythrin-like domain-containing protein
MIGTTDAVTLLRQESRRLEELLAQLRRGGDPKAVVAELARRLRDHVDVTEGIFYPTLRERAQDGVPPGLLSSGTQQHAALLRLLDELDGAGVGGERAAATLAALEEQPGRHLEYEETRILPAAEDLLDDDTLLDLGRRIQQRKQVLEAQHELVEMVATARAWLVRALAAAVVLGGLALAVGLARRAARGRTHAQRQGR